MYHGFDGFVGTDGGLSYVIRVCCECLGVSRQDATAPGCGRRHTGEADMGGVGRWHHDVVDRRTRERLVLG